METAKPTPKPSKSFQKSSTFVSDNNRIEGGLLLDDLEECKSEGAEEEENKDDSSKSSKDRKLSYGG